MNNKSPIWSSKYRQLFLHSLISWLISILGDAVDTFIAGNFISSDAVSAVELVYPLFNVILFFCIFLTIGISTVYANATGAGDKDKAYSIAGMGLFIAPICGIAFTAVFAALKNAFFVFYSGGSAVDLMAKGYYNSFLIIAFLYPVYWLIYYLVMIEGDMNTVLIADAVNVVSNVVISMCLAGPLGLFGIGLGTAAGLMLSGAVLCIHFTKKINTVHFRKGWSLKWLVPCLKISSATSFTSLYMAITDLTLNKLVISYCGEDYLPVYAVVNLVLNLALCFLCGMDAAAPLISSSWGERNKPAIRRVMKYTTLATLGLSAVFTVVLEFAAGLIPPLYDISGSGTKDAIFSVRLLCLSYPVTAILSELVGYYSRIRKELLANVLSASHMLVFPCILAGGLCILSGFRGLVWGLFAAPVLTLAGTLLYIRLRYGKNALPYFLDKDDVKYSVSSSVLTDICTDSESERVCGELFGDDCDCVLFRDITYGYIYSLLKGLIAENGGRKIRAEYTLKCEDDSVSLTVHVTGKIICVSSEGIYDTVIGLNRYRYSIHLTEVSRND